MSITARELRTHYRRRLVTPSLPPPLTFAAWCAQTHTTPETHGDLVAIPHTLENRRAMDTFSDYKVCTIQDGMITLRPRRSNEVY